jgi:hypothetical protein
MDGVNIRYFSGTDDTINSEVALMTGASSNTNGLVSHLHMHGIVISLGIHRDRLYVQLLACTDNTNSYLSTISDQNLFKHRWFLMELPLYIR